MSYLLSVKAMLENILDHNQWKFQGKEGSVDIRSQLFENKVESIYGPSNKELYCSFFMTEGQPLRLCFDKGNERTRVEAAVSFANYLKRLNDGHVNEVLIEGGDTRSTLSFHIKISGNDTKQPRRPVLDINSAKKLIKWIEGTIPKWLASLESDTYRNVNIENDIEKDEKEQQRISQAEIPKTEKERLIKARYGQGFFRERVFEIENQCRITYIDNPHFLVASHIKPWRDSDNKEKLDGNNGLLLSPHVDRLFDRGWISFTDDGRVLCSDEIARSIMEQWCLDPDMNVGGFNCAQKEYLAYHRKSVYKGAGINDGRT